MQYVDSLIIIPTYNERENIERIIQTIFALELPCHILIVEDHSPDGTADIVKRLQKTFPESLHLLERPGKQGLGTAYIAGFEWALQHPYQFIFEMDADFSHNPADVPRLYEACKADGVGVSIGSRYVTGVNIINWPMGRLLMSWCASRYVRLITGLPIADTTAGFVCYRRTVLEAIKLEKIRFKGYAFQIEMKFTAYKLGYRIVEVPVIFINRELGVSKMNTGIFGEAFFGVISMKVRSWFVTYKRKKHGKHVDQKCPDSQRRS
ncbi:MAG: polyprenol monophosphomannose synthase [Prevotellaceae bacterium]|jgi:dolichol-phosphate mannosyltransferase|nr:polyprenol monophosphomannose synthase [Prevotellaceae bacterium]